MESARQTPVSSFLQERLQKERHAESQKHAAASMTPRSTSDMNAAFALSTGPHKSPSKAGALEPNRPQSSSGPESQRKGLALKEMEQVSLLLPVGTFV
jgi:hypothetical protein